MPEKTKEDHRAQPWKKVFKGGNNTSHSPTKAVIIMKTAEDDGGDQAGG
jgi:hypothetical protein